MSPRFKGNQPAPSPPNRRLDDQAISAATEARVRQLIANDDHRNALEEAKEIHRKYGTLPSETLLVDAYAARIRSLIQRSLRVEAKALLELVCQRYPAAHARLGELNLIVVAHSGSLDELVRPLNDPALAAERRAAIERAIQQEVCDLAALARCEVLPVDHSLRKAASALDRAFIAVTSGPVADDELALDCVSHRSPLAPWKLLVRAIAYFYRGDDETCRRQLDGIKSESAPARLVPAIRVMVQSEAAAPPSPAAGALSSRIIGCSVLQSVLQALDVAFAADNERRILKAIREAVQECRRSLPSQLERLQQHVSVRSAMIDLDPGKVAAAMGGPSRHDASFLRLFARGMEETRDPENLVLACRLWDQFRQQAAREGWFAPNGPETAILSLHIAELLQRIPDGLLRELQQSARSKNQAADDDLAFLFPERLYQRACALDPHSDAFSQWMDWTARRSPYEAECVAEAWHKIRPRDLKPILHLMNGAAERRSFHTALGYLAQAEQIDRVHSDVRGARLRLLVGSALRHLQQRKFARVEEEIAALAGLPQAQQEDRPAFLAALRYTLSLVRGNSEEAATFRAEIERLLKSRAAAAILLAGVATASKHSALEKLGSVEKLSNTERAVLPAALARVSALAADMQLKLDIPWPWMIETAKQFPARRQLLGTGQLRMLAEAALSANHFELAYAVSAAGLERGGATAARFLLLRAQSLPARAVERRAVCAAAAAELGRQQRDMELVPRAVELARNPFDSRDLLLTADQAAEVLKKEKAELAWPKRGRGPDYRAFIAPCQCPDCRRARGQTVEPFDDVVGDEDPFGSEIPPDLPPEITEALFEEIRKAILRGESLDEFVSRLLGSRTGRDKRQKGRRR